MNFIPPNFGTGGTLFESERQDYYHQQIHGLNKIALVGITDSEGKIKYANEMFCQVSGYTEDELIGQDHRLINSHYHSKEFFANLWGTIKSGNVWRGEIRNLSKQGRYYWVDTCIVPVKDQSGKIFEFLAIRFDITDKKETDGLFKELINTSPEGFLLTDINGKIIEANEAYEKISGYSRAELLTMSLADLESTEAQEQVEKHINNLLILGYDRFETKHRRKNGSAADIEVSVSFYPIHDGVLTVFIRDVSEIKKIIKLLKIEKDRAEKLGEAKTRFLSTMSHEIRTPLNGIIGMVRLLMESSTDKTLTEELNRILRTSEGLNAVINEILDYSRIESGKIHLEKSEFSLAEVVDPILNIFEMSAKQKGIQFSCKIAPEIPKTLVGDAFRIRQILTNLVGNAVKFTPRGSVTLLISLKESNGFAAQIDFEVRDTGIGIDSTMLKNLANPFVQADNSISRKYGGSGLGLFISKNLLNLMDSNLEINSALGVGSSFRFCLGLNIATTAVRKVDTPNMNLVTLKDVFGKVIPHLCGKHIVVVEDDYVNQIVISGYLKVANIKYTVVDNGEDCLNLIHEANVLYDAILMDVHMPVLNGLEATERIRKMAIKIPIIALTAGVTEDERKHCISCGMDDILMKPVEPLNLANILNKYLTPGSPS